MTADNLQRPAMNLQLFNEGGDQTTEPQSDPQQTVQPDPQPAQTTEPQYNSLNDFLKAYSGGDNPQPESDPVEQPQPAVESDEPIPDDVAEALLTEIEQTGEAPTEQKTAEEQMILGKFKTQEDLIEAYKQAEKKISEYGQDHSRARQDMDQLRHQVYRLQNFLAQQRSQPKQPEMTDEQREQMKQKFLDQFYENPTGTIEQMVQRRVNDQLRRTVEPIQRDFQMQQQTRMYQDQIDQARAKYPDFDDYQTVMQQIVKERGKYIAHMPDAVDVIYELAKSRGSRPTAQPQPQQPESTPQSTHNVQDPQVRQAILQDPSIRKEILRQYAEEVKAKRPAQVLGNQPGQPAATPPEEIRTTKDAKKASLSFFERFTKGATQ